MDNIINKRNWRTGYFIQSARTAHWPKLQIDLTNETENRMVFENFKEEDKGRSRKKICICERKEDAELICKAVNNYDSLLSALKDMVYCIENESYRSESIKNQFINKSKEAIKQAETN